MSCIEPIRSLIQSVCSGSLNSLSGGWETMAQWANAFAISCFGSCFSRGAERIDPNRVVVQDAPIKSAKTREEVIDSATRFCRLHTIAKQVLPGTTAAERGKVLELLLQQALKLEKEDYTGHEPLEAMLSEVLKIISSTPENAIEAHIKSRPEHNPHSMENRHMRKLHEKFLQVLEAWRDVEREEATAVDGHL